MNWYEYPAWGAIGLIGCWFIRSVYGLLLAYMALRHGQPVKMSYLGGYQLGEAAITPKPSAVHIYYVRNSLNILVLRLARIEIFGFD
jgi:hypothetical protein